MLDRKLKAKWIRALRSGRFKQGKSALVRTSEEGTRYYCCLGVLCEVAGIKRTRYDMFRFGSKHGSRDQFIPYSSKLSRSLTPAEGSELAMELSRAPSTVSLSSEVQHRLADMNDHERGFGFKRIARWIEKNL